MRHHICTGATNETFCMNANCFHAVANLQSHLYQMRRTYSGKTHTYVLSLRQSSHICEAGLPDFSWYKIPEREKMYHKLYEIATKFTKVPEKRPNGHKIYQHILGSRCGSAVKWCKWENKWNQEDPGSLPTPGNLLKNPNIFYCKILQN
jgi:hypothetical protein